MKRLVITLLICFYFTNAFSQPRKFPSPPSANAIVNPLKGNAEATADGKKIYTLYCVTCHGTKGKGDGIAASGLLKPPADHSSDFVQKQTDGAIFWVISEGNNPMPTYKTTLTETQRWKVVNYIRTLAKSPPKYIAPTVKNSKDSVPNNKTTDLPTKKILSPVTISPSIGSHGDTSVESPGLNITYGKYNFVPGDKIIFDDAVQDETPGKFPSKWDLLKGHIEVAELKGEQVIAFMDGNRASITPLMKEKNDYLPDVFTIEFDHFVKRQDNNNYGYYDMWLSFFNINKPAEPQDIGQLGREAITCGQTGKIGDANGQWPEDSMKYYNRWHHIAISYNKGNIKIYTDQYLLANLPKANGNPHTFCISCTAHPGAGEIYIKNIRIAIGGSDLYKRVITDGKIVTHGILFEVNKADIKPESMGTINAIVKLMKEQPDYKFEIDGHTDGDGEADHNMKLSQARADTVKYIMVAMGIDSLRLTTKGYGKSKPIDKSNTPAARANNSRVEFLRKIPGRLKHLN